MEYFHVQYTLFAMSDKKINIKNPYAGKKRKVWNKPTKPFPNKCKRELVVIKTKIINLQIFLSIFTVFFLHF